MKTTKEMIEVMQASLDGKIIEYAASNGASFWTACNYPSWEWKDYDYRIKPEPRVYWKIDGYNRAYGIYEDAVAVNKSIGGKITKLIEVIE